MGESTAPMNTCSPSLDPQSLATALASRLASQLLVTAKSLGLGIAPARIVAASWRLLGGLGEPRLADSEVSGLADAAPLPVTEEGFETHDYLHLVPEEMRRALGQVMTPRIRIVAISETASLEEAQAAKHELICRKLDEEGYAPVVVADAALRQSVPFSRAVEFTTARYP